MEVDILIIGAGFAGASTAYHLSKSFSGSVLMVDQEEVPGYHASGRNASLALQSVEHPRVRKIVAASVDFYRAHRDETGYHPVGSLLLGTRQQLDKLRDPDVVESFYLNPEEVYVEIPLLKGHRFDWALRTPFDGVVDISRLLQFYLDGARQGRFELKLNCRIEGIRSSGSVYEVSSSSGSIRTTVIVDCAGAWAPRVAEFASIEPRPMRSFKRHLFVLGNVPHLSENWPFVWSVDKNFYFRPESGGLLFSVCDEELWDRDFAQTVNPEVSETLAELISEELPGLQEAHQRRVWSCFRTKTPDGAFHIGWSQQKGFFWVAGLGGHGMGASWEVGRQAASEIQDYFEQDAGSTREADPAGPATG